MRDPVDLRFRPREGLLKCLRALSRFRCAERLQQQQQRKCPEQRPDDTETAAFYALSLLAVGQVADDQRKHNARAAKVLEEIHEEQPQHPGASHYTIHANDIVGRAAESPEIVRG